MEPNMQILKDYLTEVLTTDPEYKNKGTKKEVSRTKHLIAEEAAKTEHLTAIKEKIKETSIFRRFRDLIEYIEENNVTDESADEGEGYTDSWRSTEFNNLITKAKEELEKRKYLPFPLKEEG